MKESMLVESKEMNTVEDRKREWLWKGRLALGSITLLAGHIGSGKSLITADVAARISSGECFPFTHDKTLGKVVMISSDNPSDILKPRLKAAKANLSNILFIDDMKRNGDLLFLDKDLVLLEECLSEIKDVKLVIIDTIEFFCKKPITVLRNIKQLSTKANIAFLITHLFLGETKSDKLILDPCVDVTLGISNWNGHPDRTVYFIKNRIMPPYYMHTKLEFSIGSWMEDVAKIRYERDCLNEPSLK